MNAVNFLMILLLKNVLTMRNAKRSVRSNFENHVRHSIPNFCAIFEYLFFVKKKVTCGISLAWKGFCDVIHLFVSQKSKKLF